MMPPIAAETLQTYRTALIFFLTALVLAACGLGMDVQARVDRGQQAYGHDIPLPDPQNAAAP